MYAAIDMPPLFSFLSGHTYHNLHTRKTRQVKGQKAFQHLHAMRLKNERTIGGYFCGLSRNGTIFEIQYEIDRAASITVLHIYGIGKSDAIDYINQEGAQVMKRVTSRPVKFSPSYKAGQFYLKRSNRTKISSSAGKAVSTGVLTTRFVTTAASWNLTVIQGH